MDWRKTITTVSTFPPKGLFTRSGEKIAKVMARPYVSPKGKGSAIRMVQMFINRAGRKLSLEARMNLNEAKEILQLAKNKNISVDKAIKVRKIGH